ncbi:hypothetical protein TUBRATIS_007520 [Tubulinosema ratisbonensis]|uniref:Uncharacterized protein n=1 Tax=Tubulinosema ratisbonensis TaxID=291195 RepID=A0A437AP15_9MICR|nr:hypothetical protein TUBRATIS_007520 [Tubulinosema ratisbonensis]
MLLFFLIKTVFLSEFDAVEQIMKALKVKLLIAEDWIQAMKLAKTSLQIDAHELISKARNEQEMRQLFIGSLDIILSQNLQYLKEFLDQNKVVGNESEISEEDLSEKEISDENKCQESVMISGGKSVQKRELIKM